MNNLIFAQLRTILNYAQDILVKTKVHNLRPELELVIKAYIYRHTVLKKSQSIGQEILELKLYDSSCSAPSSTKQNIALGLIVILLPYLLSRLGYKLFKSKTAENLETWIKMANLVNFVIFLTKGQYRSLQERALNVSCGYNSLSSAFNPVNYDFMSRELLWFTFAEFASFALPLINMRRVKNTVSKWIKGSSNVKATSCLIRRTLKDINVCSVCDDVPTNAREIGCPHVFCYYCVMSSFIADQVNGFKCPKCNFVVVEKTTIREVILSAN